MQTIDEEVETCRTVAQGCVDIGDFEGMGTCNYPECTLPATQCTGTGVYCHQHTLRVLMDQDID